jgi:hypothetical protein
VCRYFITFYCKQRKDNSGSTMCMLTIGIFSIISTIKQLWQQRGLGTIFTFNAKINGWILSI